MSSSHYTHTFTWPPTPSKSVIVTGTFDDWSGTVHHLHQNKDTGYWEGKVDMPFGERVAYKYVVDGHWLIREDEAKEWGEFSGPEVSVGEENGRFGSFVTDTCASLCLCRGRYRQMPLGI
jgi:1,4-alpha-glucan branching enzyme